MSTSPEGTKFDPYYKWLGIPKREQPPNHYRLLGVKLFEVDPQVIEAAAQRQAAFIHGCGERKYQDLAQRLIADVASARACLLDPAAKSQYDELLQQQQPRQSPKTQRASRYDSLQVHDLEVPALAPDSEPAAAPILPTPAAAEPDPESDLIPLGDDPPKAAKAPPQPAPPARRAKSAAKASDDAVIDLGDDADLAPEKTPAKLPPLPPLGQMKPMSDDSEGSSGKVIKLVVAGCVLAGGITAGVLWWMSSTSPKDTSGNTGAQTVAETPSTPTTAAPKATAVAGQQPGGTKAAPVATPGAKAVAPPDVAAPAEPVNIVFLNSTWNWQSPKGNSVISLVVGGTVKVAGTDYTGGWQPAGTNQVVIRFGEDRYLMVGSADGKSLDGKTDKGILAHAALVTGNETASPSAGTAAPAPADAGQQPTDAQGNPQAAAPAAKVQGKAPVVTGPWIIPSAGGPPTILKFADNGVVQVLGKQATASWEPGARDDTFDLHLGKDVYTMALGPDGRSLSGKSASGKTISAMLGGASGPPGMASPTGGGGPAMAYPAMGPNGPIGYPEMGPNGPIAPRTGAAPAASAAPAANSQVPPGPPTGPVGPYGPPGTRGPRGSRTGVPRGFVPPPGVAVAPGAGGAAATPADEATDPSDAVISDWIFPLRNVTAFRAAWIKGDDGATINYDGDTRTVTIDGGGDLGGINYAKEWRQVFMTLHAETMTGKLEIQINDTTLKFGTATALIRKPAVVEITYDPTTFKLVAMIGTRQIATATTLGDAFPKSLKCLLRVDGGKTNMKVQDFKVR